MRGSDVASASCPHELDETALQAAAEAAHMAFQRNLRRTHDYLPEPASFSEKEDYLRDCYVEMCRAAFGAYRTAVMAADVPMLVPVRWIDREELEKRFPSSGRDLADANSKSPPPCRRRAPGMSRLTKAQRKMLVPEGLAERLTVMDSDTLLAAHDFIHGLMEQRFGTNKREEAGRLALSQARTGERRT